ncbi:MAG: hypothetical protein ACKO2G_10490 [Verrucomicrobiales bacterium]
MDRIRSILCLCIAAGTGMAAANSPDSSPELDVAAVFGSQAEARLTLPLPATLFETRKADRVISRFPAGQEVVVLGMDGHGLRVQMQRPHGPLRGWISRKLAMDERPEANAALEAWYRRELTVAGLLGSRQAALNLTAIELERIFGAPTRRTLAQSPNGAGARIETLEWIRTEKVDLNKALGGALVGLDKNSPIAHPAVETGRLTAECRDGVVTALDGTLEAGKPAAATQISPPLPCPFAIKAVSPPPGWRGGQGTALFDS